MDTPLASHAVTPRPPPRNTCTKLTKKKNTSRHITSIAARWTAQQVPVQQACLHFGKPVSQPASHATTAHAKRTAFGDETAMRYGVSTPASKNKRGQREEQTPEELALRLPACRQKHTHTHTHTHTNKKINPCPTNQSTQCLHDDTAGCACVRACVRACLPAFLPRPPTTKPQRLQQRDNNRNGRSRLDKTRRDNAKTTQKQPTRQDTS